LHKRLEKEAKINQKEILCKELSHTSHHRQNNLFWQNVSKASYWSLTHAWFL